MEFNNVKYIGENTKSGLIKNKFYDVDIDKPKKSYAYQLKTYIDEETQIMELYSSKISIKQNWKINLTNEL